MAEAMRDERWQLRERIREALDGPVEEADKLLSELTTASSETKLSILISGWGRGLAAALEELAIAIDDLRQAAEAPPENESRFDRVDEVEVERERPDDRADTGEASEAQLLDEAKKSREATAALREEAQDARRELEQ
jgi:hypothetical protein